MITTIVAVMCKLAVAVATIAPDRDCTAEELRVEEIVTDSEMDETVTLHGCLVQGQLGLADWKVKHPIYGKPGWRVALTKCVMGRYVLKGQA